MLKFAVAGCLLLHAVAFAGVTTFAGRGTSGAGARPLGMGGAFVALADDTSAVYWNPAGLGQYETSEAAVSWEYRSRGRAGVFGSAVAELSSEGVLGFSWERWDFSDDEGNRKEDTLLLSGAAEAPTVAGLFFGLNGKLLSFVSTVEGEARSGVGFDLGALYVAPLRWDDHSLRFGVSMQDVLTSLEDGGRPLERVPRTTRAGVACRFPGCFVLEADYERLEAAPVAVNGERGRFGGEGWLFGGIIGLRAGYISRRGEPGRYALGASVRFTGLGIDYAHLGYAPGEGVVHRYGLSYRRMI